jgi:hypothetical protein
MLWLFFSAMRYKASPCITAKGFPLHRHTRGRLMLWKYKRMQHRIRRCCHSKGFKASRLQSFKASRLQGFPSKRVYLIARKEKSSGSYAQNKASPH